MNHKRVLNLRKMGTMVRHLEDDYEVEQLNPVYAKNPRTGDTKYSSDDITKAVETVKESASLRLRLAFMEAVIDTEVEEAIEENPEITSQEIHDLVDPALSKAVDLALVPSQVYMLVDQCIVRHRKRRDPHMVFLEKCATFMTQSMTSMEEEQTTVDIKEEIKDAVSPETEHVTTDDDIVTENEDIVVEAELPAAATESMRMLAASTVNRRKAQALVIYNIAGVMSAYMTHELRNCLPEKFQKKYCK